jgi:hypothetical protein
VWLNIQNFKMFDRFTPHFIVKYVGPYEIFHKLHLNVYTLKLPNNFVAHPTFHVLKFKLFLWDNQRPDQKRKVELKVDAIGHKLAIEIKNIFCVRQTHLRGKEYLVKYKGCLIRRQYGWSMFTRPFAINGKQVWVRMGSQTWNEKYLKKKERPTYKQPKRWWGHQPLKWRGTPKKLTTH